MAAEWGLENCMVDILKAVTAMRLYTVNSTSHFAF
jgi:hypothetical protein